MEFEYDPAKSASNQQKHGIDFEQAQQLWNDPYRLELPARSTTEPRWLIIGKIQDKHWSAIITYRNQVTRLISVRRSRPNEITIYES